MFSDYYLKTELLPKVLLLCLILIKAHFSSMSGFPEEQMLTAMEGIGDSISLTEEQRDQRTQWWCWEKVEVEP